MLQAVQRVASEYMYSCLYWIRQVELVREVSGRNCLEVSIRTLANCSLWRRGRDSNPR